VDVVDVPGQKPDPVREPVAEPGAPNTADTGELGSEGGSQAELAQAVRVSARESAPSDLNRPRTSWSVPALLLAIVLAAAVILWFVTHAVGC
jgi:hypothetical protein